MMMNVSKLISSIEALGLVGNEIVVSRSISGIHAVFGFEMQTPMVRKSSFEPYVFGRKNARCHALIEVNLANYPNIKQARADALKVSTLLERLHWVMGKGLKSADADVLILTDRGTAPEKTVVEPCYYPVQGVEIGHVPRAGRLELMFRGGVQVLVLGMK